MKNILILVCISFIAGCFLFAWSRHWFLFRMPYQTTHHTAPQQAVSSKKLPLYFWKHDTWHHETIALVWSTSPARNAQTITDKTLNILEEEQIISKEIATLTSITKNNQELFISFNQNPFDPMMSTHDKLMIIETILKNIREAKIPIQSIRFLIQHQPFEDDHIYLIDSWPLSGFLAQ